MLLAATGLSPRRHRFDNRAVARLAPHTKLQQLRLLAAVAQNDLNFTPAASKLCTTQPAVSKQLRLLEDELGFNIFVRSGRTLAKIAHPGERVVQCAMRILLHV